MRTTRVEAPIALAALLLAMGCAIAFGAIVRRAALPTYLAGTTAALLAPGGLVALRSGARRGGALLVVGLSGAPIAAVPTWLLAHPVVHVDVAGDEALQIWIDGAPGPIVPPSPSDAEPPHFRVAAGEHVLGWSRPGERAPRETTRATIGATEDHLYNPGGAGCYWLQIATYGDASARGEPRGPQRIAAFYRFDHVDVWFRAPPSSVLRARALGGARRVALRRHPACMALTAAGCDPGQRNGYVACERALTGPGEPVDCFVVAKAVCEAGAAARRLTTRP